MSLSIFSDGKDNHFLRIFVIAKKPLSLQRKNGND